MLTFESKKFPDRCLRSYCPRLFLSAIFQYIPQLARQYLKQVSKCLARQLSVTAIYFNWIDRNRLCVKDYIKRQLAIARQTKFQVDVTTACLRLSRYLTSRIKASDSEVF